MIDGRRLNGSGGKGCQACGLALLMGHLACKVCGMPAEKIRRRPKEKLFSRPWDKQGDHG